MQRIQNRVIQGGHNVPENAVFGRFDRGWENFKNYYQSLADAWAIYDNSENAPELLEKKYETKK